MRHPRVVLVLIGLLAAVSGRAWAAPEGQVWAAHVSLVPTWFDPGETTTGTQFMVTFALHDALLKPMPGQPMAPSLAEAWTASPDGSRTSSGSARASRSSTATR